MRTSTNGLLALMNHEGIVLASYKDSVGVWTIGVGHTKAAGLPQPAPGRSITLKEAVKIFRRDVKKYEAAVSRAVTVPLKQHEFDALVSFHYNTGGISRAKLTQKLNAGDRAGAARGFMGWVKPPEIRGRRLKEQELFATGNYGNLSTVLVYPKVNSKHKPTGATQMSTADVLGAPSKPGSATPREEVPAGRAGFLAVVVAALAAALAFITKQLGAW
jgi:lysozyme